jgi:hypothetical protein
VSDSLVEIDRAPDREIGLCNLFGTRQDRIYDSLELLWSKWLALPEVSGSKYEGTVRQKLRGIYYNSAEAKIHDLRIEPALRELGRLRAMGEGYISIAATLATRKISKLRRDFGRSKGAAEQKFVDPGPGLA